MPFTEYTADTSTVDLVRGSSGNESVTVDLSKQGPGWQSAHRPLRVFCIYPPYGKTSPA